MVHPFSVVCRAGLLLLMGVLLGGCVKVSESHGDKPVTKVNDKPVLGANGRPVPEIVMVPATPGPSAPLFSEAIDPCAARLHEVEGLLLKYHVAHRRLPERLEDLAPMADPGQKVDFNCPFSSQAYVYVPQGEVAIAAPQKVLVCAPTPGKDGRYRAIILRPATGSSMAALPDVVTLTAAQVKPYLKPVAASKPGSGGP